MWTITDYETAANKISSDFIAGVGSINDLATKVASTASLNSEGVRTLVRLANVTTFEHMFAKCAEAKSLDRDVKFVLGDPEQVIQSLCLTEKIAQEKIESTHTNINPQVLDFYGSVPDSECMSKTASYQTITHYTGIEASATNGLDPAKLAFLYKQADKKMKLEMLQADAAWSDIVEKVANIVTYSGDKKKVIRKLACDIYSVTDQTLLPELQAVCYKTKVDPEILKEAEALKNRYIDTNKDNIDVINMLKEAAQRRIVYTNILAFTKDRNAFNE